MDGAFPYFAKVCVIHPLHNNGPSSELTNYSPVPFVTDAAKAAKK